MPFVRNFGVQNFRTFTILKFHMCKTIKFTIMLKLGISFFRDVS